MDFSPTPARFERVDYPSSGRGERGLGGKTSIDPRSGSGLNPALLAAATGRTGSPSRNKRPARGHDVFAFVESLADFEAGRRQHPISDRCQRDARAEHGRCEHRGPVLSPEVILAIS